MPADSSEPVDARPPEPMPWDRLGMFCEDLFTVTRTLATRNQDLWSSVSHNLGKKGDRGKNSYTADDATTDAAGAMSAAMANVQDVIDLWIRYPERERVAAAGTTAFLLFTPELGEVPVTWTCESPIWLRLPSSKVGDYEPKALIELNGPNPSIVDALRACLVTDLGTSRQAYCLSTTDLDILSKTLRAEAEPLVQVYTGSVYVKRPTQMLVANLRIIIEPVPKTG